jgi:hypothetical protein
MYWKARGAKQLWVGGHPGLPAWRDVVAAALSNSEIREVDAVRETFSWGKVTQYASPIFGFSDKRFLGGK